MLMMILMKQRLQQWRWWKQQRQKWPSEYQKVIKSYLHTYLWYSSDSSASSDSSDRSDSCDSNDSSDSSDSIDSSVSSDDSDLKLFSPEFFFDPTIFF